MQLMFQQNDYEHIARNDSSDSESAALAECM